MGYSSILERDVETCQRFQKSQGQRDRTGSVRGNIALPSSASVVAQGRMEISTEY